MEGQDKTAAAFDAAEKRAVRYTTKTNNVSKKRARELRQEHKAWEARSKELAAQDAAQVKRLAATGAALVAAGAAATSFATDLNAGMANVRHSNS